MRLYLSGPMRGYANNNKAAFDYFAKRLRKVGYEVFNPADKIEEAGDPNAPGFEDRVFEVDMVEVCRSQGVAVFGEVWNSDGCDAEITLAKRLKKPVHSVETWVGRSLGVEV